MPTYRINLKPKDLGRFQKKLGSLFLPSVIRMTSTFAKETVADLRRSTEARRVVDRRSFLRGWVFYRVNWATIVITNRAKHAIFVERGRRKRSRMPPDAPIRDWVKRKGLPESAVWPIRKKIADKGIKPRKFLTSGAWRRKTKKRLRQVLQRELNAVVRRSLTR